MKKLTSLIPDPKNANKGTPRGRRELEKSLREHGWVEAGVLDKHDRIIGGNKRQEVAVDIGMPDEAIIVDHDGRKPIFVRLTNVDLDTPEGRRLAYQLNRVAQLDIEFDAEVIAADLDDGLDLSGLWEDWELDALGMPVIDDGDLAQPHNNRMGPAGNVIVVGFGQFAGLVDASLVDNTVEIIKAALGSEPNLAMTRLCEKILHEGLLC